MGHNFDSCIRYSNGNTTIHIHDVKFLCYKFFGLFQEFVINMIEWMDEKLMDVYLNRIWRQHTKKQRALLVMDKFKAHVTDSVTKCLEELNSVAAIVPGDCTSKVQPLDVSINKPVKEHLRRSWTIHGLADKELEDDEDAVSFKKLKPPSKQEVLDWIVAAWKDAASKVVQGLRH